MCQSTSQAIKNKVIKTCVVTNKVMQLLVKQGFQGTIRTQ